MVKFFINRPVFAWVIAIMIMVAGALAIHVAPVSQYPPIAPPSISVDADDPGASAKTVETTVTQIIEEKMTGLDSLLYLASSSDSSGHGNVTLTFRPGTDPDVAWSKVQNKLEVAKAMLPQTVQETGVTVTKSTRNIFMVVALTSSDHSMSSEDLQDYLASNIENTLARVDGVGQVDAFGTQHAMRIWLDPGKLVSYKLTPGDLGNAVKAYNVQVSAGQAGSLPAVKGQGLNVTVNVQEMLQTPRQFENIPVRINSDGSTVRLKDVARAELGTEAYETRTLTNGLPSAGMVIRLASGANALDTSKNVKDKMQELARYFPAGVEASYPYETTPFVSVAIHEVAKTLVEAVILVFFVMLLFLGNIRATMIPTIAVPVVLLGSFAMLQYAGMSINMLTMFAMVLAIGLLVDDAIVVVENVERIMHEEGLPVREATMQVHGAGHRRPGGHRPGAGGGVRPHGLFRRFHRHHLPAVLGHPDHRHAAVGGGGPGADPVPVHHVPQAGGEGPRDRGIRLGPDPAVLPVVRPEFRAAAGPVPGPGGPCARQGPALCHDLPGARRQRGLAVLAAAHAPTSPTRTRARCWCRRCCRPARPWSAPSG